jgi:hypothetical protein
MAKFRSGLSLYGSPAATALARKRASGRRRARNRPAGTARARPKGGRIYAGAMRRPAAHAGPDKRRRRTPARPIFSGEE